MIMMDHFSIFSRDEFNWFLTVNKSSALDSHFAAERTWKKKLLQIFFAVSPTTPGALHKRNPNESKFKTLIGINFQLHSNS